MTIVALRDVSFEYVAPAGSRTAALRGVSLSIGAGETVALLGRSGSGKSTLAQILAGVLEPSRGGVTFVAHDGGAASPVRLLFQFPEVQLFAPSALEDVAFGPRNAGLSRDAALDAARSALDLCGVPRAHHDRAPWSLSDGERRRVALAGILALSPRLLVLDEPEVGLDREGREGLERIMMSLAAAGTAIVVATHDVALAARRARRAILLDGGRVVRDAAAADVLQDAGALVAAGVEPSGVAALLDALARRGWPVRAGIADEDEAYDEIMKAWIAMPARGAGSMRGG